MSEVLTEVPTYNCADGWHAYEDKGTVIVKVPRRFLCWRWVSIDTRDKYVCRSCKKVAYQEICDYGGL